MKRLLISSLWLMSSAVLAQDFRQRADIGERVMSTEVGDAYLVLIAPVLEKSVQTCSEEGARMASGERVAVIARVSRDGAWSSVETESDSPASACLAGRLQAARLPPPPRWNWDQGEFPLALSIGAGRGTVNGIRQGD